MSYLIWLVILIELILITGLHRSLRRAVFLVLVSILLFLLVIVSFGAFYQYYNSGRSTRKEMNEMKIAVLKYRATQGKLPVNLHELIGNSPIKKSWYIDEWNNAYRYNIFADNKFEIVSSGKDGQFNTSDDIFIEYKEK